MRRATATTSSSAAGTRPRASSSRSSPPTTTSGASCCSTTCRRIRPAPTSTSSRARSPRPRTSTRAGIEDAAAAIVFPKDGSNESDMRSLVAVLAIESMAPKVRTVVEVNNPGHVEHFRRAKADEILVTSRLTSRLLARSALYPGLTEIVTDIVSGGEGSELYRIQMPSDYVGLAANELSSRLRSDHRATLLAIARNGQTYVNPPDGFIGRGRRRRGGGGRVARRAVAAADGQRARLSVTGRDWSTPWSGFSRISPLRGPGRIPRNGRRRRIRPYRRGRDHQLHPTATPSPCEPYRTCAPTLLASASHDPRPWAASAMPARSSPRLALGVFARCSC